MKKEMELKLCQCVTVELPDNAHSPDEAGVVHGLITKMGNDETGKWLHVLIGENGGTSSVDPDWVIDAFEPKPIMLPVGVVMAIDAEHKWSNGEIGDARHFVYDMINGWKEVIYTNE